MRLAAYAGASTVLAASIVLRAFHERPNFYSASVYLAQSSACRMILLNLLLLTTYGIMRALQKVLYGPLRAIEREQLWDKAWYAVTETALAMTTFRDEVGAWFFVMFVSLLAGKVWGWISEARVEALEQQPPTNPRLFHIRLTSSLVISELFDFLMLRYCVNTLLEQPRPGMMVMFAFEFAVLAISSTSTTMKYLLSLRESFIIKQQTKARVEERRQEIRASREEAQHQAIGDAAGASSRATELPAMDEEIDENEIDVPGWQEKGRWTLFLDLLTDLLKLLVYLCFFIILLMFHGIPIHIIRDVFLTTRSFFKRISDFLKYRNATRDMNARYPDATAEELARDGTCIICREEMQPWEEPNPQPAADVGIRRPARMILDERQRPKKLPCGHILHFGCLRSWLERQQVCPTCRSSVLGPSTSATTAVNRQGNPGANAAQPQGDGAHLRNGNRPPPRPGAQRARTFNLGPWRFAFAAGNEDQVREALQRLREEHPENGAQVRGGLQIGGRDHQHVQDGPAALINAYEALRSGRVNENGPASLERQIARIEEQIGQEVNSLNAAQEQLAVVRALQQELARLRTARESTESGTTTVPAMPPPADAGLAHGQLLGLPPQMRVLPFAHPQGQFYPGYIGPSPFQQQVLRPLPQQVALGPGHSDLPAGLTLPPGWTLMPLQRERSNNQDTAAADSTGLSGMETVLPQLSASGFQIVQSPVVEAGPSRSPRPVTTMDASSSTNDTSSTLATATLPAHANGQNNTLPSPPPTFTVPAVETEPQEEVSLTPNIPNWSDWGSESSARQYSAQTGEQVLGSEDNSVGQVSNGTIGPGEGESSSSEVDPNVSGTSDKGKAKMATVEDTIDEADG